MKACKSVKYQWITQGYLLQYHTTVCNLVNCMPHIQKCNHSLCTLFLCRNYLWLHRLGTVGPTHIVDKSVYSLLTRRWMYASTFSIDISVNQLHCHWTGWFPLVNTVTGILCGVYIYIYIYIYIYAANETFWNCTLIEIHLREQVCFFHSTLNKE